VADKPNEQTAYHQKLNLKATKGKKEKKEESQGSIRGPWMTRG
jgi:hypothetical protein